MDGNHDKRTATTEEFKLWLQVETTLLAWVRTSLALMGFGFVVARFGLFLREIASLGSIEISLHPRLALANSIMGTALIVLGVIVLLVSIYSHQRLVTRLLRGDLPVLTRWSLGVMLSMLLVGLGMCMAIYLVIIEL